MSGELVRRATIRVAPEYRSGQQRSDVVDRCIIARPHESFLKTGVHQLIMYSRPDCDIHPQKLSLIPQYVLQCRDRQLRRNS